MVQPEYELPVGIQLWFTETIGGSDWARLTPIQKVKGLPEEFWGTFNTTAEDSDSKAKTFGIEAFAEGAEMTFSFSGEARPTAWALGGKTVDFQFRFKSGKITTVTCLVTRRKHVEENNVILTEITLKPSGELDGDDGEYPA